MLKMMWVAIGKKYCLKDARHSGYQMRTVAYRIFFFPVKGVGSLHHSEVVQSHKVYKAIVCNANLETSLVIFHSYSAPQPGIQESFGNP